MNHCNRFIFSEKQFLEEVEKYSDDCQTDINEKS